MKICTCTENILSIFQCWEVKIERYLMVTRIKLPYKINMILLSEKPVTRYIMTHGKEKSNA